MMKSILIRVFLPILVHIGTPTFRRRAVELVPLESVQRMRHISDVLYERSVAIFTEKRAALAKGDDAFKGDIGEDRDIMSILCESPATLRNWWSGLYAVYAVRENILASNDDRLPDDELIAQMT